MTRTEEGSSSINSGMAKRECNVELKAERSSLKIESLLSLGVESGLQVLGTVRWRGRGELKSFHETEKEEASGRSGETEIRSSQG